MKMTFTRPLPGAEHRTEIVVIRTRIARDSYSVFITAYSDERMIRKTLRFANIIEGHAELDKIVDKLTGDRGTFKMK